MFLPAMLLAAAAGDAIAGPAQGFVQHRPYDPITASFGLPAAAHRVSSGEQQLQLSLDHDNIFTGGITDSETLQLDGETSRLALRHTSALSDCLALDVAGQWLYHGGGTFDRAIDDWHQWFGLPDADRDQSEQFVLDYRYENADGRKLAVSGSAHGIGDVSVALQRPWQCGVARSPLLRVGIKLPSGSARDLLGSGTTDAFADLQLPWYSPRSSIAAHRWAFGALAGALRPGEARDFPDQRALVGYGALAIRYRWSPRLQLIAQLDGRTALFDSDLAELGDPSLVLTTGLRWLSAGGDAFDITIAEDVIIDTAPDIVLRLAWTTALTR